MIGTAFYLYAFLSPYFSPEVSMKISIENSPCNSFNALIGIYIHRKGQPYLPVLLFPYAVKGLQDVISCFGIMPYPSFCN